MEPPRELFGTNRFRLTNHRGRYSPDKKRQVGCDVNGCDFSISSSARRTPDVSARVRS
jgi:hypothetical protein